MATSKANMQKLIEQRDRLLAEMEALKNKIAGLEMAIQLLESEGKAPGGHQTPAPRKSNVKAAILDLLQEVGTTGLNAYTAVEIAARRGVMLDRGSVSSLLSRLKRDGIIEHDGDKYRLPQFTTGARSGERASVFN